MTDIRTARAVPGMSRAEEDCRVLQERGYASYGPQDLEPDAYGGSWREDLARLTRAYDDLPHDPYASPTENRFRRYSRAVHLPWDQTISWIPGEPDAEYGTVAEFVQNRHPDHRGGRTLPAIPPEVRHNALLTHVLRFDARRTQWRREYRRNPLYFEVHLMKFAPGTAQDVAVASPDRIHQDGDDTFVFAHLISRTNIVGGENLIARPQCAGRRPDDIAPDDVLATFTLDRPLESYGLYDPHVSHYVAPMRRGTAPGPGARCLLLIGVGVYGSRLRG
ncbi:2OG-Fe dioxygenase family protein [Streptomyces mobaraensis]|uniref:2OG-Fe dioxygenase family protein n=1 Tax=Streptomyces mobaraensis TaxID=35621 RepID=UPI001CCB8904|nr:2OG-Fe dioxygenase family protein [Streptomyces mobaraensis]UBI40135.1 2OG-Fe dioxygenase family protein [Streptomyces mobaraensis]